MVCHGLMLSAVLWRTVEPGFAAYRTGSCIAHGRAPVSDITACARASDWYSLASDSARHGSNRSIPVPMQPTGCYYSNSEQQLYFNAPVCKENEQWCRDWIERSSVSCTKESTCLCECSFLSLAVILSLGIFALPMPLQWRMLHSSALKCLLAPRPDPPAAADALEDGMDDGSQGDHDDEGGDGEEASRHGSDMAASPGGGGEVEMAQLNRTRGSGGRTGRDVQANGDWREGTVKCVPAGRYTVALQGLEVQEMDNLSATSVYKDEEKGMLAQPSAVCSCLVPQPPRAHRTVASACVHVRSWYVQTLTLARMLHTRAHTHTRTHARTQARKRIVRLQKELRGLPALLEQNINSAMWVRYDSDRPQYMRAVITGPSGSPYEAGVFVFDFFFPLDYPQVPPKVTFLTTGGGSVRFNPNLYADGKVCLSLLGTYDGPRWMPGMQIVCYG